MVLHRMPHKSCRRTTRVAEKARWGEMSSVVMQAARRRELVIAWVRARLCCS